MWRLLYESAARSSEVLGLDVDELDLRNRRAQVRRKGGAVDVIVWRTGTARLLPRLLDGRRSGPVFTTDRRARVELPPADVDAGSGKARLSNRRAAELFETATGGWTLHQLRHSALTHAAERDANTSTLLAYSGHTAVVSPARYARVSGEALARWQAGRDPAARRRRGRECLINQLTVSPDAKIAGDLGRHTDLVPAWQGSALRATRMNGFQPG
ncbi:site-specific integrase [Nonomuraea diastatica]|uniref:site-specific integrase n=1 Tax=Nonomuraea diastatica TaxID=1848329 RepID=UPI001FE74E16|nr:site-specific integrase [Nonomuraea diastatica]